MKCSDCGKEIKPVVAIDIDGTLADYHGHLIKFAQGYLQSWPHYIPYDGAGSFREWFCGVFDVDRRVWDDVKLAYRQGGMKRTQPVLEESYRIFQTATDLGAEVWLTTTRPFLRLDNIDPDTRFWLRRNGMSDYYGLLYDEHKYRRLAESVDPRRVVAVVDDLSEQYDSAEELFGAGVPILRRGLYNRAIMRRNVGHDTRGVCVGIMDRVRRWRYGQGGPRQMAFAV